MTTVPPGLSGDEPLRAAVAAVLDRFAPGAAAEDDLPELATLARRIDTDAPTAEIEARIQELSHSGHVRDALVALASRLHRRPDPTIALILARELLDALAPELGVRLCEAVLGDPTLEARKWERTGPFVEAHRLLGDTRLESGDAASALLHFEAVLSVDVDHRRALRGVASAWHALESKGLRAPSRGLAVLDGLDELDLRDRLESDRYELRRPLGRGRHAVVYEAWDRHVGRMVAIKRLLPDAALSGPVPARVVASRFFAEAKTLACVRSRHVIGLLDARPERRFVALQLCRGGNLRMAMRRGLVEPADLPRLHDQLRAALLAVHTTGAVHRDVKPANILVREDRSGADLALADFGLAIGPAAAGGAVPAGTLRYLAPELRQPGGTPSPASDRFSAGVVLLELALAPAPLPDVFDRADGNFEAASCVPDTVPTPWAERLRRLLSSDPGARTFDFP